MSNEEQPAASVEDDLPEQLRIRREKRAGLIERGVEPIPFLFLVPHRSQKFARSTQL